MKIINLPKKNRKLYLLAIIAIITIIFLYLIAAIFIQKLPIRDQNSSRVLQYFERKLDAQGDINRQFHVSAAANLEVPGYIIGVEKALKNVVGFSNINITSIPRTVSEHDVIWEGCEPSKYLLYDDTKDQADLNLGVINSVLSEKMKKYNKVTYVSHITKFSYLLPFSPDSNLISEELFNSYSCRFDSDNPICNHLSFREKKNPCRALNQYRYDAGWQSILDLKSNINQDLSDAKKLGKPYTHIILYSMGWNTTQREAIQDFNFLQGNLINLAKQDKDMKNFNPLMIAITWPSDWSLENGEGGIMDAIIRPARRMVSFFTKMDDADEVGDIWGNILLREVLIPINDSDKNMKLVLIGHSFGTRVMANSIFADPLISPEKKSHHKIDLLIGLQGAFPVTSFIDEWNKSDHSYYDFDKKVRRVVFTWSPYDSAVGMIKNFTGSIKYYIGSKISHDYITKKYPELFEEAVVDSCGNFVKPHIFAKNDFEKECFNELAQQMPSTNSEKLLYVDASKLINHQPQGKSGGAHSDIFHDGVTRFILNNIKMIDKLPE